MKFKERKKRQEMKRQLKTLKRTKEKQTNYAKIK